MSLPSCDTLVLEARDHALHITLNRPQSRNAMSLQMVRELMAVFEAMQARPELRAVVLRGADGHFCAGGDIKDMAGARASLGKQASDPFFELNREFGRLISYVNQVPQVVVVVLEGAVLGGGFGLACVSDVAIAAVDAKFGLPETGLGIPPAQIAPFVVARIGLTQARRLALLGARFNGEEALRLGLVHHVAATAEELQTCLDSTLADIKRCAPQANAVTKALMLRVGHEPMDGLLDDAARQFSAAIQSKEGTEGTMAFIQKRLPHWAQ